MKVFTVLAGPRTGPVLVPEGFAWGAFVFGPIWLLVEQAWVPGLAWLVMEIAVGRLAPAPIRGMAILLASILLGSIGRDLVRWSFARRGFALTDIVAAPDADAALVRLIDRRPDLAGSFR